ncbi:MAG: TIR domain-containing protein [Methylococcaceae bacterium]
MNKHKVFISFSSKDTKLALKIYDRLNNRGIKSWISAKDISPGADYQSAIVKAIEDAEIVVLVFSAQAASSNEILKELSLASKKTVIPARIEDIEPEDAFKYQLSNRQFIDLFNDFDRNLEDLVDKIVSILPPDTVHTRRIAQYSRWLDKLKRQFFVLCKKVAIPVTLILIIAGGIASVDRDKLYSSTLSKLTSWTDSIHIGVPWSTAKDRLFADVAELKPLGEAKDQERLNLIKKAIPDLTEPLNAKEVASLLEGLNVNNRVTGITMLNNKLAANLNGEDLVLILAGLEDSYRGNAIESLKKAEKIKAGLSAAEAAAILKGIGLGYKGQAILNIASQLTVNLNGEDLVLVLAGLEDSYRVNAIEALKKAEKIKAGLSAAEAAAILKGIGSGYKGQAISIIASQLTVNLNGEDLVLVLASLEDSYRVNAIEALKKADKIKVELSAAEVTEILKGISSAYRVQGISTLVSQLPSNLGGDELVLILSDLEDSIRKDAVERLKKAEKIKSDLTVAEAVSIMQKTSSYRESLIKILAYNLTSDLSEKDVLLILGDLEEYPRRNAVEDLRKAGKIKA